MEIADALGVVRQTVNGWWNKKPAFRQAVEERQAKFGDGLRADLSALVHKAFGVLDKLMEDDNPRVRLQATRIILENARAVGKLGDGMKEEPEVIIHQWTDDGFPAPKAGTLSGLNCVRSRNLQTAGHPSSVLHKNSSVYWECCARVKGAIEHEARSNCG